MAAFLSFAIHRLFTKRPREVTLTTTGVVEAGAPSWLVFNTTAARNVNMPVQASVVNKMWFIFNAGSAALTLKTSTGGTIIALQAGKGVLLSVFTATWRILLKGSTT